MREAYEAVCAAFRAVLQETLDLHSRYNEDAVLLGIQEAFCDLASSWLTFDRRHLLRDESDCEVEVLIAGRRVARVIDLFETMHGSKWGEPREFMVAQMRLFTLKVQLQDLLAKLKAVEFERSRAALLARSVVQ